MSTVYDYDPDTGALRRTRELPRLCLGQGRNWAQHPRTSAPACPVCLQSERQLRGPGEVRASERVFVHVRESP